MRVKGFVKTVWFRILAVLLGVLIILLNIYIVTL